MKAIILGTLAATMITGVAKAACNDIPNPTRFNPQELSAYQECWLDEHKAEETAGILGSLAWVRLNDEYFSAPISQIRKMRGSDYAEKFIAAIEPELITEIVRENEKRIVEVRTEIEYIEVFIEDLERIKELEMQIDELKEINANLKESNSSLNDMIESLEADLVYVKNQVQTQNATIQAKNQFIAELNVQINNLTNTLSRRDAYIGELNATIANLRNKVSRRDSYIGQLNAQITSLTTTNAQRQMMIDAQSNMIVSQSAQITDLTTQIANANNVSNETTWTGSLTIPTPSADSLLGSSSSDSWAVFDYVENAVDDGDWYGVLDTMLEDAFAENYDRGYADGYSDGYEDGYEAGVDAVQDQL